MTKATHNGTCQVCGNAQAIKGLMLAKHGYTVDWGFFNGTCAGSDNRPIEFATTLATRIILQCDRRAKKLEALTLDDIKKISYVEHVRKGEKVDHVFASQAELDEYRLDPVRPDMNAPRDFGRARENSLFKFEREATMLRQHIEMINERISLRHGADPYPRDTGIERKKLDGFDHYRDAVAAAKELKADGWKTRVNGRRNPWNVTATRAGS